MTQNQDQPAPQGRAPKLDSPLTWLLLGLAGIGLMLFGPSAWLRILGASAAVLCGGSWVLLSSARIQTSLFVLFMLAFVFTPYWTIKEAITPVTPWLAMTLICILGLLWSMYHKPAGDFKGVSLPSGAEVVGWLVLFVIWCMLQAKALYLEVPWRGDEYFHIREANKVLQAWLRIKPTLFSSEFYLGWPLVAAAVTGLIRICYPFCRSKAESRLNVYAFTGLDVICRFSWILCLAAIWACAGLSDFPEWTTGLIQRYPYLRSWIAVIPALNKANTVLVEPWWMRIGVMVSIYVFGCIFFSSLYRKSRDWLVALTAGLAFLTLPLAVRYGAMMYIEPFFLPFFAVVAVAPSFLTKATVGELRKSPAGAALAAYTLWKETAVVAVGVTAILRIWMLFKTQKLFTKDFWLNALKEICYLAMIGLGIGLFLHLQGDFMPHTFTPDKALKQLTSLATYTRFCESLWETMGLLPFLAVAGLIWLIVKRIWGVLFVYLGMISAYVLLFAIDDAETLGYARMSLHILPFVIALTLPGLIALQKRSRWLAVSVMGLVVVFNLFLHPYDFATGITKPQWGCHNILWFEQYYPAEETVEWVRDNQRGRNVLFYMHDYGHSGIMWHIEKNDLKNCESITLDKLVPGMIQTGLVKREVANQIYGYMYWGVYTREHEALHAALYVARRANRQMVVYLCSNGLEPPYLPPESLSGYTLTQVFKSKYRALAVYELPTQPAQ